MISRVTVLLPLVPEIDTIGTRRSASRTHSGGVARAASMRSVQRASSALLGAGQLGRPRRRDVALGEGEGRLADGLRTLGADPREGDDPVARVRRAVDRQPAAALAVVRPQAPDPGDRRGDRVGPVTSRDIGAEVDERVAPGIALPVPRPAAPDGELELDHRLEPVDVRTFEQAGLDQTHGPGRIARCQRPRLTSMTASTVTPPLPSAAELDALRAAIGADLPAYLEDLARARQHRLRELHAATASTRWAAGSRRS